MKKRWRRILTWCSILIGAFILALIFVPFLFQDEITERIKRELNKQINAKVDFEKVSLSLIKSFPNFSISVQNLSILVPQDLDTLTLLAANKIQLESSLTSIIHRNRPISIHSFAIQNADVAIEVDENGKGNYNIRKKGKSNDQEIADWKIEVDRYSFQNCNLSFMDLAQNIQFNLNNLNHTGRGDFSKLFFDLNTSTKVDSLTLIQNSVTILNHVKLNAEVDLQIDLDNKDYKLTMADIGLNEFLLKLEGDIGIREHGQTYNLKINNIKQDFKELLSIMPAAYTKDFERVDTRGAYSLVAAVNGTYDSKNERFPKMDIQLMVENAYIKFPELLYPVEDISLDVRIQNPKESIEGTEIQLSNINFEIDGDHTNADVKIKYSRNNSGFEGAIKGQLDLNKLFHAYPLTGINSIQGLAKWDFKFKGTERDVQNRNYNALNLNGTTKLSGFTIQVEGAPTVQMNSLNATADRRLISFQIPGLSIGNTELKIAGKIENPLSLFGSKTIIPVELEAYSPKVDYNEFVQKEKSGSPLVSRNRSGLVDRVVANLHFQADTFIYQSYVFREMQVFGKYLDDRIDISSGTTLIGQSDLSMSGSLNNVYNYSFLGDTLIGMLSLNCDQLRLNDFMDRVGESKRGESAFEQTAIPNNLNLVIHPVITHLSYGDLVIEKSTGVIEILPNQLNVNNLSGFILNGSIKLDAVYNTVEKNKPVFLINYDLSSLSFARAVQSFRLIKPLAPIAAYMDGRFNSQLTLRGTLNESLFPDLGTLSGSGFMETVEGKIRGFSPLEKLNQLFGWDSAKEWTIKNTKNWFAIEEGYVGLKEFELEWNGVRFLISGKHRINFDMDYRITAKIPRALLEKNAITKVAGQGLDLLNQEIAKAGLSIKNGDYVDIDIFIKGMIDAPKLTIKPLGISQSANFSETLKKATDTKISEAKDSLKSKLDQSANKLASELKSQKEKIQDSLTKELSKKASGLAGGLSVDSLLKTRLDSINSKSTFDSLKSNPQNLLKDVLGKDKLDSIKNKLKVTNPFKKKKNNLFKQL